MDAVQFGRWISERRSKYGYRSQRALAERASGDPTLGTLDINENFLARLEAGSFVYPFRGNVRGRVMALAWLLCATLRDVKTYYQAAGLTELDDHEAEHLRALRTHLARRQSQRVLPLPPRPQRLIGRESLVREIIASLCRMDRGLYAITGLPGIGKSALASEVVHRLAADEQVSMRTFSDGIAAFTCTGRQGRSGLLSLLADVIAFFGSPAIAHPASSSGSRSRVSSASTPETELASIVDRARLVLADKQALLLLDDVEAQLPLRQVEEALLAQDQRALLQQQGNSTGHAHRVILTTGRFIPPPALVTHHLHLEPLEPDAALELFTALMKRSLSLEEVHAVQQVCAAVGHLPLAIEVAATAVAVEGIPLPFLAPYVAEHPLDNVLDGGSELRSRLTQALSTFDAQAQKRFAFLSTLGVATFDVESAAAILSKRTNARGDESGDTPGTLPVEPVSELMSSTHARGENTNVDELDLTLEHIAGTVADLGQFVQHSLIDLTLSDERVSPQSQENTLTSQKIRYHLHPLVYAHSLNMLNQSEPEEVQVARRNVQAYALAYIERWKGDTTRLERGYDFLVASLKRAVQDAHYGHVVQLVEGLTPIAAHMSDYEEGRRLLLWGVQASQHLSDHFRQVSFLNELGLLSRRHEEFALATQAWTESLDIATSSLRHIQEDIWCPLAELAHLAHIHGEVDASLRYAETYLKRCLERDNPLDTAYALFAHAFYARLQGNLEQAYKSVSSAQSIFSQYHRIWTSPTEQLTGLRIQAETARIEGNYLASQVSVEQAASLLQTMGNHYLLAEALFDQACFAQQQGKYDDARHLAQRTIQVAESKKLSRFSRRSAQLLQQLAEAKEKLR